MTIQGKPAGDRRRLTTVTAERPRCPAWGGVKLRNYRTPADQGDGSIRVLHGKRRRSGT